MDMELIKNILEAYRMTNREVLDLKESNQLDIQIMELNNLIRAANKVSIYREGLNNLLYMATYDYFIRFGRQQAFGTIRDHFHNMELQDIPLNLLRGGYEFACDLYDENEANGHNDEMYPYRKR